jgi:hypothetical protein
MRSKEAPRVLAQRLGEQLVDVDLARPGVGVAMICGGVPCVSGPVADVRDSVPLVSRNVPRVRDAVTTWHPAPSRRLRSLHLM